MRIVLLGKTGVGKSSTGNTILGEPVFTSITNGASRTCRVGTNTSIQVIDTPGFFDTRVSNDIISKEMVKCIPMSAPGAHAFIIVLKLSRFTQEEIDTVNLIKEIFGQDVMRYTIVLFVGKDYLDADGVSVDDFLNQSPEALSNVLSECENRCIAFNNRAGDAEKRQQSCALINLVNSLVERNGRKCYPHEVNIEAEASMHTEEEKRKRQLEEKKDKEIEAMKSILRDNQVTEKTLRDRMTKLEQHVAAEQRKTVVEHVVKYTGSRKTSCSIM